MNLVCGQCGLKSEIELIKPKKRRNVFENSKFVLGFDAKTFFR